jgi:hypothetical protein
VNWLPPLQFAALAIAVLLIVVAPRPAWVALLIAGLAAYSVRSAVLSVGFDHYLDDTKDFLQLPPLPGWLIVLGVLGWAVRRRSWRTAVAGAVYGVAVEMLPYEAPIVLFAAAAAALGPRKDVRYLTGIGVLALALANQYGQWTLIVTIIAITATLALVVWALVQKDGVNGAVALVALASAALTPLLSAGVLLAASLLSRRAWLGLAAAAAVIGMALFNQPPEPASTQMQWLSQDEVPDPSSWLIAPGLVLTTVVIATVAALVERRHRVQIDQANG